MNFVEVIAKKRDGLRLGREDIARFVAGAVDGSIGDEQLAALLMAICTRGADEAETLALTEAMRGSGEQWRLGETVPTVTDKHSTGGIGDSVSLVFAPLVAACGLPVAMMAGAGLGHTQGTLDKLGAIKGFATVSSREEALDRIESCGACFAAQSERIAPADRRLYALRDLTGTVPSLPLIVASIMSKKLAVGCRRLVLDVKAGRGAFSRTDDAARQLTEMLVLVARNAGVEVRALITDMSQPLGDRLGCASEVRAAIEVLEGGGSERLRQLTVALAVEALELNGTAAAEASDRVASALGDGSARARFDLIVEAHGGNPDAALLPRARRSLTVTADRDGFLVGIDAETLGWIAVSLGAGRRRRGDEIDPAASVTVHAVVGDAVVAGQPLATLEIGHRDTDAASLVGRTARAFEIGGQPVEKRPLIIEAVGRTA